MKSVLEEKGNCYETSPSRIARVTFAAWLEVGDTMTSPLGFLFREESRTTKDNGNKNTVCFKHVHCFNYAVV